MSDVKEYVARYVARAKAAQAIYAGSSQKTLDKATRAIALTFYNNAEMLAHESVDETGYGYYDQKLAKLQRTALLQWRYMKGRISTGVMGWETGKLDVDCILKIAKPAGIVASLCPSTNPTCTVLQNSMCALKGGNAVIICPHPSAKNCTMHTVQLLRAAIGELGLPEDLIQCIDQVSHEISGEVMKQVDLVIATGGAGIVKAANASGTPSYGVGQGNVQMLVDTGISEMFDFIAEGTITSRSFENGLACTCEQTAIIPAKDKVAILAAFERKGAFIIDDDSLAQKLREILFMVDPNSGLYRMNPKYVGKTAQAIGAAIGLDVPADKKILFVKLKGYAKDEPLCKEKLCPITGFITYEGDWKEAIAIAKANLLMEGTGHSSCIYTNNKDNEMYAGLELPVGRLVVNQANNAQAGTYTNGLVPASGLACGFWQGNSTSENVNFTHYLNFTRIIYTVKPTAKEPTPEEIWAEE